MFDVGSEIILEHLGHLRKGGLLKEILEIGKKNDFDSYEPKRHFTEEQEWVRQDDDSLY